MKMFGSWSELVSLVFRKSSRQITVTPNAQTVGDSTIQIPNMANTTQEMVLSSQTQTLTGKSMSGASNTFTAIPAGTALSGQVPTANGGTGVNSTATFPTSGVVDTTTSTVTLQNKTLDNTNTITVKDTLLTIQDATTATKTILFDAGGTAATSTTITAAQTANRVVTLPDATTTLVGTDTTQTLTNKTFSGTDTFVDSGVTFVDDGDNTKKMAFQLSGITTATTRTLTVPDASTTIVGTDATQVLTNKDHDGGTASNTSRITLPKASTATLTGLTRKQGTIVYDTSVNKPLFDDGSVLHAIGSGSGGGRNYLSDYADGSSVGTVGSGNVTDTGNRSTGTVTAWQTTNSANISISSSSSTPLRETTSYLTTGSGNAAAGTTFIESPAFTIDTVDLGKAVSLSFDVSGGTTSTDWDVCMVRYNSSGTFQEKIAVAGTASTGTPASALINTGTTTFRGFFIANSTQTDYYAVRFRRLAGTVNLELDTLFCGPGSYLSGYAGTDWASYTGFLSAVTTAPTLGTGGTSLGRWRRVGDSMELHWGFNQTAAGSAGSGVYLLLLPTGYTIDLTKAPDNHAVFDDEIGSGYMNVGASEYKAIVYIHSSTALRVDLFTGATATGTWSSAAQSFGGNANYRVGLNAMIPISQWSSNVQLADRAVEEYASNSSTNDAANTTSFVNDVAGSLFPGTLTTTRDKRVRFTTAIQATDTILLEYQNSGTGVWLPVSNGNEGSGIIGFTYQGAQSYGVGINRVAGSTTDVDVSFGRYINQTGTTYASAGENWSNYSTWRYRVRKISGGAGVGYPIAPANITFLNVSENYSGNTKLGIMPYSHGTTYNGGNAPTITLTAGGGTLSSVSRSKFMPYQMADSTWRLRFNFRVAVSSTSRTTAQFTIAGTVFQNGFNQAVSGFANTEIAPTSYTGINDGTITIDHAASTTTSYHFSGDVELESKPTWAY